ncbi:MAG: hypothetical protein Ct9H300mP1_02700 [Planctomycetaceae bacterium]|nr:MAG: hypothetical protein Ct9H300mP1_02700 [Planctomycetaceae bacterium]
MLYDTTGPVPEEDYTVPLGTRRPPPRRADVTIVAISRMVSNSLEAADRLWGPTESRPTWSISGASPPLGRRAQTSGPSKRPAGLGVVDEDNPRCSMASDVAALAASRAWGTWTPRYR